MLDFEIREFPKKILIGIISIAIILPLAYWATNQLCGYSKPDNTSIEYESYLQDKFARQITRNLPPCKVFRFFKNILNVY